MAAIIRRANAVKRNIESVETEQEQWKIDHDSVQACYELHEMAGDCLKIYNDICSLDLQWNSMTRRYPDSYQESDYEVLFGLFLKWHGMTGRFLEIYRECKDDFEARGFNSDRMRELMARQKDCAAILVPNEAVVDELVDAAIASHRRGESVPMGAPHSN